MTRLRSYLYKISWSFIIVGVFSLVLLIFLITASVARRKITGDEIIATMNVAEFLLVIITFLGLSWTQIKRGHVAAEFFVTHFSKRAQQITEVAIALGSLVFTVILVWATGADAVDSFVTKKAVATAGTIITVWPIKFILPLGGAFYIFTLLFDLKDSLAALVRKARGSDL